jgi:hypothetical protein
MELGERDRPVTTVGPSPGPGSSPDQVWLDVDGPSQLFEPMHLRVVVGKPVAEDTDRLHTRVDAGRTKGGAHGLGVADDLPANGRLRDGGRRQLGRRASGGIAATWWARGQAQLVTDLPDAVQPCTSLGARRLAQMTRALDLLRESDQVVVPQLVERLACPDADHRQRVASDLADPVGAPAQPLPDLGRPVEVDGVDSLPERGQLDTTGLRQQQLHVGR